MNARATLALACGFAAASAYAAEGSATAGYSPAGNVLQVLLGLAVVLLVMWACVRALKRYTAGRQAAAGTLRVLGGVAVGQRERVVMVEVGETWLVVGVAPGRVNALHTMQKLPDLPPSVTPPAPPSGFAASLARFTQRNTR
ncbi:MAG TPA: flagellar biosynthetic protein FliO [Burkholderiales bacterium]|nr:flagellar biosynthetic protein FliO [Burkholderiales bacterium]